MLLASFILSIVSIVSVGLIIYVQGQKEIDEIENNFQEFEELEELESRINALEYSAKAFTKNSEILASQITKLEVEIIDLKSQVNNLSKSMQNAESSINNLYPFADKTRGMVEENSRRIDRIEGSERN